MHVRWPPDCRDDHHEPDHYRGCGESSGATGNREHERYGDQQQTKIEQDREAHYNRPTMTSLMLLLLISSKVAAVSPGMFSAKQAEIAAKLSLVLRTPKRPSPSAPQPPLFPLYPPSIPPSTPRFP